MGDLGKIIVATGFEWLPIVQKIAQSGHSGYTLYIGRSIGQFFIYLLSHFQHADRNISKFYILLFLLTCLELKTASCTQCQRRSSPSRCQSSFKTDARKRSDAHKCKNKEEKTCLNV